MLTRERKALMLARLARDGRLVATDLAQEFATSEDTIRRDLRALAGEGKLQRVHGGALPASPALADFSGRASVNPEGKARLAAKAATLVAEFRVVFLDGGTTNVALARALAPDLAITVVTHSPSIAVELAAHPAIAVELIGGRLFKHSVVAMGTAAARAIGRIRPDLFVMGVTGLHPEAGATTGDAEEAEIKALIAAQSAETLVIAGRDKVGAASPYQIAPVAEINTILLDRATPPAMRTAFAQAGPEMLSA